MQSFRKSVVSSFLCSKGAGYSSSLGTIGLMKAVDTFDSTRRARFSTYASRCIENAILSPAHFGQTKKPVCKPRYVAAQTGFRYGIILFQLF